MSNVLWEHRIQDEPNSVFHKEKLESELVLENEEKLSKGERWGRASQTKARAFAKAGSWERAWMPRVGVGIAG